MILGSGNVQDIALRFLSGEQYDAEIANKNANAELAMLLNSAFEAHLSAADTPSEMRYAFARHVLTTEFLSSLSGPAPEKLAAVKTAEKRAAKKGCIALVIEWRNRQDLRERYAKLADAVGPQLQVSKVVFEDGASWPPDKKSGD